MTRAGSEHSPDHTTWSLNLQTQALPVCQVRLPSCCALLRLFFFIWFCLVMFHGNVASICTMISVLSSSFVHHLYQCLMLKINTNNEQIWAFPVSDVKSKWELKFIIRWLFPQNVPLKVPAILTCTLNHFLLSQSVFSRHASFPQLPMKLWDQTHAYSWNQILWYPVVPFPFLLGNAQSCERNPQDDMLKRIN